MDFKEIKHAFGTVIICVIAFWAGWTIWENLLIIIRQMRRLF